MFNTVKPSYLLSLLKYFVENLVAMLNFNLPESNPNRPIWKVFIMDGAGQKILAPLMKVNDLREHGVTLFLQLKAQRERLPDVPVVYFVEPCPESISLICQVTIRRSFTFILFLFLLGFEG